MAFFIAGGAPLIRAADPTPSTLKSEHFDRDPGWEGYNNRIVPKKAQMVQQDFGYSATHFAGKDAGEMGGRIQRCTTPASYAAPLTPAVSLDDKLTASGSFAITSSQGSAGVFFGFFNSQQPGGSGRPIGSLGMHFDFEKNGGRLSVLLITSDNKSCGTFITPFLPGKFRPTPLKIDGTRYQWTLNYDPQGAGGNGRFTFTLQSDTHKTEDYGSLPERFQQEAQARFPNTTTFSVDLKPGLRTAGATFDRFGMLNGMKSGGAVTMFFDDLQYDGHAQDFSKDPDWVGVGNRASFEDHEVAGAHNFGYSAETSFAGGAPGEIGGGIWRSGPFAFYADHVGPLNLEQRLEARGKVKLVTAGPDSDISLGWFNSAAKDKGAGDKENFVGIHVGGPTRIGHYFIPVLVTSKGAKSGVKQGPVLVPGKVFDWSLVYDPAANGGNGEMRVTLGTESVTLALKPGQKAQGASLDRFGFFTFADGGQMVKIYIDDLEYTARKGAPAAKNTNTPRNFPKVATKSQWQQRAREIRQQILVSSGLWPMPRKTPLHAKIFDKTVRDGYSVEKVYLQPWPGFYLAGNLYRPVGQGNGPFPAIINPHGHWAQGRLTDTNLGSIPARCISFARQGMIAFTYDMVGYNDTRFADSPANAGFPEIHHHFGVQDPANLLWNVTLMGLQTWDSIRALDFVEALPDVDKTRLACTGASGGGSQTFILGAIDDRLAAQAPVNMVSHVMQGGCLCENMPGLRVEYSNMEIAAAAAPRPQILVAATGDWTKTTPTVEGPAVQSIYRLFDASEKLRYIQFDAPHNYNKDSREAVYGWFGQWLLNHPDPVSLKEAPYQKVPDEVLRVWPNGKLPSNALREDQLIDFLKKSASDRWKALLPKSKSSLQKYKQTFLPAWRHTVQVEWPVNEGHFSIQALSPGSNYTASEFRFRLPEKSDEVTVVGFAPIGSATPSALVILADSSGGTAYCNDDGRPIGLAGELITQGNAVWIVRNFSDVAAGNPFTNFFTTYNRTIAQERVRDLTTLASAVGAAGFGNSGQARVVFCGSGNAGLWMLLAAPAADVVVADCASLNTADDQVLLAPDVFCPGLHNLGGFEGVAALAAPHPLLLHNLGENFSTKALRRTYAAVKQSGRLRAEPGRLDDATLARWISSAVKLKSVD